MMLMRTDPFRELDRLTQQVFGTAARPAAMPMDAWQEDGEFVVAFDLPGVDVDSVDLNVERNVLTVRAERRDPTQPNVELVASERPRGVFPPVDTGRDPGHGKHQGQLRPGRPDLADPGCRTGQARQDRDRNEGADARDRKLVHS